MLRIINKAFKLDMYVRLEWLRFYAKWDQSFLFCYFVIATGEKKTWSYNTQIFLNMFSFKSAQNEQHIVWMKPSLNCARNSTKMIPENYTYFMQVTDVSGKSCLRKTSGATFYVTGTKDHKT